MIVCVVCVVVCMCPQPLAQVFARFRRFAWGCSRWYTRLYELVSLVQDVSRICICICMYVYVYYVATDVWCRSTAPEIDEPMCLEDVCNGGIITVVVVVVVMLI